MKNYLIPDELLSRIRDVGAQGSQEVERRKDSGRRRHGIAAAAALAAVVEDLAGFGAIAQAFERDRWVNHVAVYTLSGLVIVGIDPLALEN